MLCYLLGRKEQGTNYFVSFVFVLIELDDRFQWIYFCFVFTLRTIFLLKLTFRSYFKNFEFIIKSEILVQNSCVDIQKLHVRFILENFSFKASFVERCWSKKHCSWKGLIDISLSRWSSGCLNTVFLGIFSLKLLSRILSWKIEPVWCLFYCQNRTFYSRYGLFWFWLMEIPDDLELIKLCLMWWDSVLLLSNELFKRNADWFWFLLLFLQQSKLWSHKVFWDIRLFLFLKLQTLFWWYTYRFIRVIWTLLSLLN